MCHVAEKDPPKTVSLEFAYLQMTLLFHVIYVSLSLKEYFFSPATRLGHSLFWHPSELFVVYVQ